MSCIYVCYFCIFSCYQGRLWLWDVQQDTELWPRRQKLLRLHFTTGKVLWGCKLIYKCFAFADSFYFINLYTFYTDVVHVYHLRMCMKEDNPSRKHIEGDHSREIIICIGWGILYDSTDSSSYTLHMHE